MKKFTYRQQLYFPDDKKNLLNSTYFDRFIFLPTCRPPPISIKIQSAKNNVLKFKRRFIDREFEKISTVPISPFKPLLFRFW